MNARESFRMLEEGAAPGWRLQFANAERGCVVLFEDWLQHQGVLWVDKDSQDPDEVR